MNHATYHTPDAPPKVYPCIAGEIPGTVDLLNAAGRAVVTGLPLGSADEPAPARAYALLVEAPAKPAPRLRAKSKTKDSVETAPEPEAESDPAP
jgi:hypothetical protein